MSVVFFLSFLVVASFIMLSLFVGAVTMGMSESIEAQEAERKASQKEKNDTMSPEDELKLRGLLVEVPPPPLHLSLSLETCSPRCQTKAFLRTLWARWVNQDFGRLRLRP